MPAGLPVLMDRAYEGNETRQLVLDLGMWFNVTNLQAESTRSRRLAKA